MNFRNNIIAADLPEQLQILASIYFVLLRPVCSFVNGYFGQCCKFVAPTTRKADAYQAVAFPPPCGRPKRKCDCFVLITKVVR